MVFLTEWKGNGIYRSSIKSNAETREALLFERCNNEPSKFASVWASYIFVFIAVLITFSIVFAVGFMVNTMSYNGNNKIPTKMFNPPYQLFNEQSFAVIQRARDHLRRVPMGKNFTEININLKNRFATNGKLEVSNKWKKAERRVTVISFPKINIRKKEQQKKKLANQEALNKLPIIEAEFQNESDYFSYYLKNERIENIQNDEESMTLEKFALFCNEDECQEFISTKYFAEKGRESLKERQFKILKDSDVLKQKENEVFNQKNAKYFEKNYYFMVQDFAKLSFELCSLNSAMITMNAEKREITDHDDGKINLLKHEIYKEELWIDKLENEIITLV